MFCSVNSVQWGPRTPVCLMSFLKEVFSSELPRLYFPGLAPQLSHSFFLPKPQNHDAVLQGSALPRAISFFFWLCETPIEKTKKCFSCLYPFSKPAKLSSAEGRLSPLTSMKEWASCTSGYLPPSLSYLLEVSRGQTEGDGASQGHGAYRQCKEGTVLNESAPSPLPPQPVGAPSTSGWDISSDLGRLTRSAHFQVRKMERSPAPKPTVFGARPNSEKPLAWEALPARLYWHTCGSKNYNTWARRQLHSNTADKKYEYNKTLHVTTKTLNPPKWPTYRWVSEKNKILV